MKKVYFISGLGADHRAFNFLDLSFCQPIFIDWPAPSANETLSTYSEKIFEVIKDEHAIIVGLSFGGMLATEIAKNHSLTTVLLLSSCKTYKEIPAYLRFWQYFPLYKLHSNKVKYLSGKLTSMVLGGSGSEQKKIQRQILRDSNLAFTRWAIHAILKWKNETVPENLTHIHGTKDRLLPYKYVKANFTIDGGEHIMVMDKAAEISALLSKLIAGQ